MVEKSKKKPIFDAKLGKKPVFLGDRLLEPKRATRDINDLRATQAARFSREGIDSPRLALENCPRLVAGERSGRLLTG
jgi:hypothetical protein